MAPTITTIIIAVSIIIIIPLFVVLPPWIDLICIKGYMRRKKWVLEDMKGMPVIGHCYRGIGPRTYRVLYRDEKGNRHFADAITGLMADVYLSRDHIFEYAKPEEIIDKDLQRKYQLLRNRIKKTEKKV